MIADHELARFSGIVAARLGLRIDPDRSDVAVEVVARRAGAHGESIAAYLHRVERERAELRALARELTVGETYFFRHAEQLAAFADVAIAASLSRGHVRVLSAGCSSGEEPYTLAMLLHERAPRPAWEVHAVDLNPAALERAAAGRFSRWALRAMPPATEARWFRTEGRDVILAPALCETVTFEEANLIDCDRLWTPGRWDVVFCRNVLMYFTEDHAKAVVARIVDSLAPGGHLFLGHAETLRGQITELELCHTHATFYYQKRGSGPRATPVPVVSAAPPSDPRWFEDIHAATERLRVLVDDALAHDSAPPPRLRGAELVEIRRLLTEERFAEARARLASLTGPIDRDAALLHAMVLLHAGSVADAEAACGVLLEIDAESAVAHYLLAQCRESQGDVGAASRHARLATGFDPSFAMARLLLGLLARRTGDGATATRELAGAIELLEREDPERLALFGGGLGRSALVGLCRTELAMITSAT